MTTVLIVGLTLAFVVALLALILALGCAVNISKLQDGERKHETRLVALEGQVGSVHLLIEAARSATAHARSLIEKRKGPTRNDFGAWPPLGG